MKKSFKEIIQGDQPVLVDFYADWCGPCQMMAPDLKSFAQEHNDRLKVIKVDVDKNQQAAAQYGVRGVPTLILFKNGNVLWKKSGALNKSQLESELSAHIR